MAIHFDTQGPAPIGFHVPLTTEWEALCGILTTTFSMAQNATTMGTYLKMPMAGLRIYANSNVVNVGSYGYYWSSSPLPSNANFAYHLLFGSSRITPQFNDTRASGFSIRCLKDTPVTPTSSWTTLYDGSSVASGAGVFWNSADGLISVSGDGTNWITIQDKNLGATTVYNQGDTVGDDNSGYFYQRGNNYGFAHSGTLTTSSTQVDASVYGPGNYYNNDTFITGSNNWSSVQNDNLRGGVSQGTRYDPMRQHGAIQTFHFKPELMEAADLIALVTTDIFGGINFSGMINELNKYPQIYYGKNFADNNLYTLYNVANTLGNGEGSAYYVTTTHPKTGRNMDTFVAYNATTGTRGGYTYGGGEIEPF